MDDQYYWLSIERSITIDNDRSLRRIIRIDRNTKNVDPNFYYYRSGGGDISEILKINQHQLIVLERSYNGSDHIKLFMVDLQQTDGTINGHPVLNKELLIDFDESIVRNFPNAHVDNLEGICIGPTLPNNNPTLLLVSDDNAHCGPSGNGQQSQIWILEINKNALSIL